jgi:hypothetical protein
VRGRTLWEERIWIDFFDVVHGFAFRFWPVIVDAYASEIR